MLEENTGWTQHNNSVGKGKGITTIFSEKYQWEKDITRPFYQLTKITSEHQDIVNVYRSDGADDKSFQEDLFGLINSGKQSLVVGDFNICYQTQRSHPLFNAFQRKGYNQIVAAPTSYNGRLIDLAFISPVDSNVSYVTQQQAQFFTDHDLIEIIEGKLVTS